MARHALSLVLLASPAANAEPVGARLLPTGSVESAFGLSGLTVGAQFVDGDVFGEQENVAIDAALGVDYYFQQLYSLRFSTGDRLGERLHAEFDLGYEVRARDPFYGIGNADTRSVAPVVVVNPIINDAAVQTRFGQHRARARATGDAELAGHLHVRPTAELIDCTFSEPADGVSAREVYDMLGLVGWQQGVRDVYGGAELRWDSRDVGEDARATGTLAAVFGGLEYPISTGAGSDFWRYGFDVHQLVQLGPGVLLARAHAEAVTGRLDAVPFTELPALGGPMYLRGYDLDRFRNRIAAFSTVEYTWDFSSKLGASVFIDAGRVYADYWDLSLSDMRAGFGGSVVFDKGGRFMSELSLASSIDGGLFAGVAFNPILDLDARARRP
jgi:hypothetical protein